MNRLSLLVAFTFILCSTSVAGTTGKIAGYVKDARTGEGLPSANVVIEGTSIGAATNIEGYYVILNVPPDRYRVTATLVGYQSATSVNVRVDIDQTTDLNFDLAEEAVLAEEVTVVAERPVVQRDVSASRVNIEAVEVLKLPVSSVTAVVNLQAGIEPGLVIRGGSSDQTAWMVDGAMLRDARTYVPNTQLSLLAVQDVQVQTGGFAAEYGDLRSGVVNVVTREGGRSNYTISFQGRYTPAQQKHFGPSIYDPNSYWIRPYVDPAVAWTGTENGAWDPWTQQQYPTFEGWNAVSAAFLKDDDPTNDLTPEAAQQVFLWEHRKQATVDNPDWDIDMGFGGPVPFLEDAGNLRFFYSYRREKEYYVYPLSVDSYTSAVNLLKVTSDIAGGMKLTASARWGKEYGTNDNNAGEGGLFRSPSSIAANLDRVSYIDARIYASDYWAPSAINNNAQDIKFTHTLSPSTFYEALLQRQDYSYSTNPAPLRDTSRVYQFGNAYFVDEAPFGFQPAPSTGIVGLRMGVGFSNSRDSSRVTTYTAKFDITSQLDKYNQIKSGMYFSYTDNDLNFGSVDVFLPVGRSITKIRNFPIYGALYLQDKLEFELMVANIGLRLDYLDPNVDWYIYDDDPYTPALSGDQSQFIDELLPKEPVKPKVMVSPRIGVAFPISTEAKLFFNYGHMRQIPLPRDLFRLRRYSHNNQVVNIADPREPIPRTIAYELGYEHSLFEEYLLRVAAYYKDETDYPLYIDYTSRDNKVDYSRYSSNGYRDKRGFEITLSKNRGNWVQGFVNYTYDVITSGYFGLAQYYESASDQREYERTNVYQEKPIPQPYANLNVDFFTPANIGPELAGIWPLANWRINFLGRYSAGAYLTWVGGGTIPGVTNNVQWTDYWNVDARISKAFRFGSFNLELFADISNLFNIKYMSSGGYGFFNGDDYNAYMKSLHLEDFPADLKQRIGYINIPGDDRPGDYRDFGVAFQPIVPVASFAELSNPQNQQARPFYYVADQKTYYQFVGGAWQQVEQGRLDQVLEDKAYIDMPNQEYFWFLNPRRIFWGIRFSLDF
jgi:hypothetical protein